MEIPLASLDRELLLELVQEIALEFLDLELPLQLIHLNPQSSIFVMDGFQAPVSLLINLLIDLRIDLQIDLRIDLRIDLQIALALGHALPLGLALGLAIALPLPLPSRYLQANRALLLLLRRELRQATAQQGPNRLQHLGRDLSCLERPPPGIGRSL